MVTKSPIMQSMSQIYQSSARHSKAVIPKQTLCDAVKTRVVPRAPLQAGFAGLPLFSILGDRCQEHAESKDLAWSLKAVIQHGQRSACQLIGHGKF